MMVKMMVSYWMNDNGALAGDGDDGNQLSGQFKSQRVAV